MLTLSEIKKLPIFRTLYIISVLSYSICPPVLILYYFDPKLFLTTNFLNLILLVLSNGVMFLIGNFWISIMSITTRMKIDKNITSGIFEEIAINASIYSFFIMSCAYGFGIIAISLDWAKTIKKVCEFILIGNGTCYLIAGFALKDLSDFRTPTNLERTKQPENKNNKS